MTGQLCNRVFQNILNDSKKNKSFEMPDEKTARFEEARFNHGASDLKKKIKLISAWEEGKDKEAPHLDYSVSD